MLQWLRKINFRYRITTLASINLWLLLSFVIIFGLSQANFQSSYGPFPSTAKAASSKIESSQNATISKINTARDFIVAFVSSEDSVMLSIVIPLGLAFMIWVIAMLWQYHTLSHLFGDGPIIVDNGNIRELKIHWWTKLLNLLTKRKIL